MSNWASMELKVNVRTEDEDIEKIYKMHKPVKEFCQKHNIEHRGIICEGKNYMLINIQIDGLTSRYCRGCMYEVRQMLREIYKCKVETLFEAY